jgi:WhiB family transcriptional regulator, redox-sensing transcriptional regulator
MSSQKPLHLVTSNDATGRSMTAVISPDRMASPAPVRLTDQALWTQVARYARCADGGLDPDEWFPVSLEAGMARQQAAAAIAVCAACPVREECLALSLRHWGVGQHGVWGGLVAADRAQLRARLSAEHTAGCGRDAGAALMSRPRLRLVKGREAR